MSVPSYIDPDDSYTLENLRSDSGDSSLKFDLDDDTVVDSEGSTFVDENGNSWKKDYD